MFHLIPSCLSSWRANKSECMSAWSEIQQVNKQGLPRDKLSNIFILMRIYVSTSALRTENLYVSKYLDWCNGEIDTRHSEEQQTVTVLHIQILPSSTVVIARGTSKERPYNNDVKMWFIHFQVRVIKNTTNCVNFEKTRNREFMHQNKSKRSQCYVQLKWGRERNIIQIICSMFITLD